MIVDTSAIVAVVVREPGYEDVLDKLTHPGTSSAIGSPTAAELGLVLSARLGGDARPLVVGLLDQFEIATVQFGDAHWRTAVGAFSTYGRGRHRAALNFGDCMAYAVASLADEPLLFAGDDFVHTDLIAA